MHNSNNNSLFFNTNTHFEIDKLISNVKIKYSTDLTDFNIFLIKRIKTHIIPIQTFLFNKSLSEGILPNILKIAKVEPIFKKGDISLPNNYRPISFLPQLSKIFLHVVHTMYQTKYFHCHFKQA